jgi:hypothetical protein
MPKELTHWLIAQESLLALPPNSPVKLILAEYYNLFFAAAVLPDTPYYCVGKKCIQVKHAVDYFHAAHQTNSFAPLTRVLETKPHLSFEAELSFTAGIISHIIADSVFHPFVSSLSGPESGQASRKNTARHRRLETEIDLLFMRKSILIGGNMLLRTYVDNLEVHIDDLAVVLAVFFDSDNRLPPKIMKKSLRDHCLIQSLFYKKWPTIPLRILNMIKQDCTNHLLALSYRDTEKLPPLLNDQPIKYKHPWTGHVLSTTMEHLKEEAVEKISPYLSMLQTVTNRLELKNTLKKLNGPSLITGLFGPENSACPNAKRPDDTAK